MTDHPLPQVGGADLLTHSRMACFKKCPKKHYFQYELGVRTSKPADALRVGSAVHKCLEKLAKGTTIEGVIAWLIESYADMPTWCVTIEDVEERIAEMVKVRCMIEGYYDYWAANKIDPATTVAEYVAVEIPFEVPIINPKTGRPSNTFSAAGKIDAIVRLADGRLAVMEHKTTSDDIEPTSDYWTRLKMDQQISLYYIAAQACGYEVSTVLYDVLKKPRHSPTTVPMLDDEGRKIVLDQNANRVYKANGEPRISGDAEKGYVVAIRKETSSEYRQRLMADMVSSPGDYFVRREVPRLGRDIEEFRQELWDQAVAIRHARNNMAHYRNTSVCSGFGQRCEYLDVCLYLNNDNIPAGFERVSHVHQELLSE